MWLPLCIILVPLARCQSGATLTGAIFDQSGAVLGGGYVRLFSQDRLRETKSGLNGKFVLGSIPSGIYELQVTSPGFATISSTLKIEEKDIGPLSFTLTALGTSSHCGEQPPATYEAPRADKVNLIGEVSDYYSGKRLPLVVVNVSHLGQTSASTSQRVSGEGEFQFENLPPGKYTITASLPGYSELRGTAFWIMKENLTTLMLFMTDKTLIVCN